MSSHLAWVAGPVSHDGGAVCQPMARSCRRGPGAWQASLASSFLPISQEGGPWVQWLRPWWWYLDMWLSECVETFVWKSVSISVLGLICLLIVLVRARAVVSDPCGLCGL